MSSDTDLRASEADQLREYRQLSVAAIVSLLLGLLAPVALAHPAAWLIPIVATLTALFALWNIHRNQDALIGKQLACFALFLALLFGACAPAKFFAERVILYHQARVFAEQWFTALFNGDLNRAHQGAMPISERQPAGTLLDEYYANNESARLNRENFFGSGTFMRLAQLRPGTTFQFVGNRSMYHDRGDWYINLRFFLHEPGTEQPYPVQVEVYRHADEDGVYLRMLAITDARAIDAREN